VSYSPERQSLAGQGTEARKQRLVGLDVLRLLAILLVLGRHMSLAPDTWPSMSRAFIATWQRGGWVGVDLFFVLSGFLVSGLLFTEYKSRGRLSVARFYMRRGWKIYPPFFVMIAVTVMAALIQGRAIQGLQLASELTFLQSYFPGMWAHTWSLAVEEHFYLLLPMALLLTLRMNRKAEMPLEPVFTIALCVAVAALALRFITWYLDPRFSLLENTFASHLRLDSLFFGVAISYAYHFHTDKFESLRSWRWPLMLGGFLLLSPPFVFPLESTPFIYTVGFTVFYLGSGMLMVGVLLSDTPRNRVWRLAAAIGAYSYSIYLWHLYVASTGLRLVERVAGAPLGYGAAAATYVVGAIVVGAIMARIVEIPTLKLRDRLFPARDRGAIENSRSHVVQPLPQDITPAVGPRAEEPFAAVLGGTRGER
jgi:peptidoglycan/LPS O-acetylase OafA/YrhL